MLQPPADDAELCECGVPGPHDIRIDLIRAQYREKMSPSCTELFEQELRRRGISFARDSESGRHVLERVDGTRLLLNLDNLTREFERDDDPGRIARFIDTALASGGSAKTWAEARLKLFLTLEPNHFAEPSDLARAVSERVDRVPVLFDPEIGAITWVSQQMLDDLSVTENDALREAGENLDKELQDSALEYKDIDGMRLAFISSRLPFKASLILAPNFRKTVEPVVGWPVLAVAPARDFLYLWNARHGELTNRLGRVIVDEFKASPYPLSTEVFELTDQGLRAIGDFPTDA